MSDAKEYTKKIAPNDALIIDDVFSGVGDLIEGKAKVDPQNFQNLNTILEAIVLHDQLWLIGIAPKDSFAQFLLERSVMQQISSLQREGSVEREVHRYFLGRLPTLFAGKGLTTLNFRPDKREETLFNFMVAAAKFIESDGQDELERVLRDGNNKSVIDDGRDAAELERKIGFPVYHDALLVNFRANAVANRIQASREFYAALAQRFHLKIERVYAHIGLKVSHIPPLMALLLDRSHNREDIPERILDLRSEFGELRKIGAKYEAEIRNADRLGDKLDAIDELELRRDQLLERMGTLGQHTRLIHRAWEVVKSGKLLKIVTTAVDQMISTFEERQVESQLGCYLNLWEALRNLREYEGLVEKTFGETFDDRMLAGYHIFVQSTAKALPGSSPEAKMRGI